MILKQKKAETYVDTAIIMVISVIVGALLLFGLKALMENIVIPKVTERVSNLFVYTDDSDDDPGGGGSAIVTPTTEKTIEKGIALPAGAQYLCSAVEISDETLYTEGQVIPKSYSVQVGDIFVYGDYQYLCQTNDGQTGWLVGVLSRGSGEVTYEEMLSCICGVEVKFADYTFQDCIDMVTAPPLPSTIISTSHIFEGCSALQGWIQINAFTSESISPDDIAGFPDMFATMFPTGTSNHIAIYGNCPKEILTMMAENGGDNVYLAQLGDLRIDGNLNTKDSGYLQNVLAGTEGYSTPPLCVADINGDGKITSDDYDVLRKYMANWDDAVTTFNASKKKYWGTDS